MNKITKYTPLEKGSSVLLTSLQIALSAYDEVFEGNWIEDFVEYDVKECYDISVEEIQSEFKEICQLTQKLHEKLIKIHQ